MSGDANRGTAKNVYVEGKAGSSKLNKYCTAGNNAPAAGAYTNTNVVKESTVGYMGLVGSTKSGNANTNVPSSAQLITNAQNFFAQDAYSNIWATSKIAFPFTSSPVKSDIKVHIPLDDITKEYNGSKQSLDTAAGWYDSSAMSYTESGGGNYTDPSPDPYSVTVTLTDPNFVFEGKDASTRTEFVNIIITKKQIAMQAPRVDSDGKLLDPITPSTMLYTRDTGTIHAPQFGLQYKKSGSSSWSNTAPTTAGNYFARPYITNPTDSFYEIDYSVNCETAFTKLKDPVSLPYFKGVGTTLSTIDPTLTTVPYTGVDQLFDLVNSADGMSLVDANVVSLQGGLGFNG
ncbi:MAG: hypothetical protein K2N74_01560, partial [Clostridiales bacterium]|nr:hypothetical protein [Clostridiales bacterium]